MASDQDSGSVMHPSMFLILEDTWPEILKRSPVKTLCRFRCVCKSWNSLISSPRFISEHLNSATSAAEFLFSTNKRGDLSSYATYHPDEEEETDFMFRDFPFRTLGLRVADVIHGVVCISRSSFNFCNGTAILFNPAIRKHFTIPWPPASTQSSNDDSYFVNGFGFDRLTNDFKVVRVSSSGAAFEVPGFRVFSVRDGRWRDPVANCVSLSFQIPMQSKSCFSNGAIHWIAEVDGSVDYYYTLLVFDFERDELKVMDLPEEVRCAENSDKIPEVFVHVDGSLAVLQHCSESSDEEGRCVMWLMKSYGVLSTWRKRFYADREAWNRDSLSILEYSKIMVNNCSPCIFKESLLLMDAGN